MENITITKWFINEKTNIIYEPSQFIFMPVEGNPTDENDNAHQHSIELDGYKGRWFLIQGSAPINHVKDTQYYSIQDFLDVLEDGVVEVSEKKYVKNKQNLEDAFKADNQAYYDEVAAKRVKAIDDARNAGFTDAMIVQMFGIDESELKDVVHDNRDGEKNSKKETK